MPGIYTAAIITTALAVTVIGFITLRRAPRKELAFLLIAFALQLPICALAFYGVRMRVDGWLRSALGLSDLYRFLTTFYAPLTEEPAKLWPLLLAPFARRVHAKNAVRVAMSLGLGFGVGEMWFLAERLTHIKEIAGLSWYTLGGFINERFMVCLIHGAFTATALRQLRKNFIWGVLAAMALHYVANFPIYLSKVNVPPWGETAWKTILPFWVVGFFFAMALLLTYYAMGRWRPGGFFFGRAKCPECGAVYDRPFFGVNLVTKRYERCPACKKWHITSDYKEDQEPPRT